MDCRFLPSPGWGGERLMFWCLPQEGDCRCAQSYRTVRSSKRMDNSLNVVPYWDPSICWLPSPSVLPVPINDFAIATSLMDPWYLDNLVCPRDHCELRLQGNTLLCPHGHGYPVVDGTPVMLLSDVRQTMDLANTSINQARAQYDDLGFYVESLGLSDEEKRGILQLAANHTSKVDPVVAYLIGATNGIAYKHLIGKLDEYPIPEMRLPFGRDQSLLDIGCN